MPPPLPATTPQKAPPLFSTISAPPQGPEVPVLFGPEAAVDPFAARPDATSTSTSPLAKLWSLLNTSGDRRRLEDLSRDFEMGRGLVRIGQGVGAKEAFNRAMASLEKPLDSGQAGSQSLAESIPRGNELYREALFASAAFAAPAEAPPILSRLNRMIKSLEAESDDHPSVDLLRARLLKAFGIMQYTAAFAVQRVERYEEAEKLARGVIASTDDGKATGETTDVRLSADVLLLELLARQTERAFHRGDVKARRIQRLRLLKQADIILNRYANATQTVREVIARYELEVIRMLGRMQIWNVALERARQLSTSSAYGDTGAKRALLADPLFAPFVHESEQRLLTAAEIREQAPFFKTLLARMQATLANARAASLKETALCGGMAAMSAFIADVVPDGRLDSVLIPAIAAAAASVADRLYHGWMSDEARSAGIVGLYEREWQESARDVARLLVQGGLETGLWLAPTSLAAVAPQGIEIVGNTLANAGDLYARFFHWVGNEIFSLTTPEPYQALWGGISHLGLENAPEIAYRLYTLGAGAQYVLFLLSPKLRPFLFKTAPYFVPGAVMLGADLGMSIAGSNDYWDRIGRSSIGVFTGLSMLLTAGVISLARSQSVGTAAKSIWEGVRRADHNALVAIALTIGVSSAMGGLMQRGERPDDIALVAMQGAATVVGLLPIVLGISGIMKRNIEIFSGLSEGWDDSRGETIPARLFQTLAGGLSAFNAPYVWNRVGRSPTIDILPAGLRSAIGWDSNPGYAASEAVSIGVTNGWATRTWPETGGVDWERNAFADMLRHNEVDRVIDHWVKATQRMPPSHILRPHGLADAIAPFWSIAWSVAPPKFPMMPQTHYFGGLQQLMDGGYWNSLDAEQIEVMLRAVRVLADRAFAPGGTPDEQARKLTYQDILRPILITMDMTRGNATHGERLQRFFDEESWLADLLTVDLSEIPAAEGRYRRNKRAHVREQVEMPTERYVEHAREHSARRNPTALPPDAFTFDRTAELGGGAGAGAGAVMPPSPANGMTVPILPSVTTVSSGVITPPPLVVPPVIGIPPVP